MFNIRSTQRNELSLSTAFTPGLKFQIILFHFDLESYQKHIDNTAIHITFLISSLNNDFPLFILLTVILFGG